MSGPGTPAGWYAACVAYFAAPAAMRKDVSPQTLATYRRIRQLPPAWGKELDRRGAPLRVVRWVAWGNEAEVRQRRYAEVLASWEQEARWPRTDELAFRDGEAGRGRRRAGNRVGGVHGSNVEENGDLR